MRWQKIGSLAARPFVSLPRIPVAHPLWRGLGRSAVWNQRDLRRPVPAPGAAQARAYADDVVGHAALGGDPLEIQIHGMSAARIEAAGIDPTPVLDEFSDRAVWVG